LSKHVANPSHPFHQFGTGTIETLADKPAEGQMTRDKLIDFYNNYYVAEHMKLVVYSNISLSLLRPRVMELFGGIKSAGKNKITAPPWKHLPPYMPDQLNRLVWLQPVMSGLKELILTWILPDYRAQAASKVPEFIAQLLGLEGTGSLASALKQASLATVVATGIMADVSGFTAIHLSISLTEKGIRSLPRILGIVETYIQFLRKELDGTLIRLFEEEGRLAHLRFHYSAAATLHVHHVSSLAHALQVTPTRHILYQTYDWSAFKKHLLQDALAALKPANMLALCAQSILPISYDRQDPYYNIAFTVQPLADIQGTLDSSATTPAMFTLPPPNPYIPQDVSQVGAKALRPAVPSLVYESLLGEAVSGVSFYAWHKVDDQHLAGPFTFTHITLLTPAWGAVAFVKLNLWLDHMTEHILETAYAAERASLHFSIKALSDSILISCSGFHDKLPLYLCHMLRNFLTLKMTSHEFDRLKEAYATRLVNFERSSSLQHAALYFRFLRIHQPFWTPRALLDTLSALAYKDVGSSPASLLQSTILSVKALFTGNLRTQEAIKLAKDVSAILQQPISKYPAPTSHSLCPRRHFVLLDAPSHIALLAPIDSTNSTILFSILFFQRGDTPNKSIIESSRHEHATSALDNKSTPKDRQDGMPAVKPIFIALALAQLVHDLISQPYFETLRTKEQLGKLHQFDSSRAFYDYIVQFMHIGHF
jgi:insulysin